ncbi:hypothetical protein, unknown function [Leishmania tarentolae]|uniref:Uncharacterized protein n=1 Tax=Leishmania tarentolae TaxID=5689 RepID=A0A640KD98_LEITA|nr:hypothetical protein, unknown function [Leishmania tarentolae]
MSGMCDAEATTAEGSMAAPNSPPECDMTAPMHDISVEVGLGGTALPHNISSWELLDVDGDENHVACSVSSHTEAGRLLACPEAAVKRSDDGNSALHASAAKEDPPAAIEGSRAALLQLFDTESRNTADEAPSKHAPSGAPAPKGCDHHRYGVGKLAEVQCSLTHSVSTAWSLLSTTSQAHLPAAHIELSPVLGTAMTAASSDACGFGTAVTESTSLSHAGAYEPYNDTAHSFHASSGMAGTWRGYSLPSSLPAAPPSIGVSHSSYEAATGMASHSTGVSSYATPMGTTTNAMLIPRVISVATTSLTSDGETCLGESRQAGMRTPILADTATLSDYAAVMSLASTLSSPSHGAPALPDDRIRLLGEAVAAREAQVDAASMALEGQLEFDGAPSMPPSPCPNPGASAGPRCACEQPAELLAWSMKPLVPLCDHRQHPCPSEEEREESGAPNPPDTAVAEKAAAHNKQREQRRAAAWLSRRTSFLSSSSLATSLLPSAMVNTTFSSAAAPVTSAASSSMFTLDSSVLWSKTCVVCTGSMQRALKGIHQLCDYVWQDLKNHWYPQLRLVLGDHSLARKIRYDRHPRRRLKTKHPPRNGESATVTTDAPTDSTAGVPPPACEAAFSSPIATMRRRSVSSPCFFNSSVRIMGDSAVYQYMSWRDKAAAAATFHFHASTSSSGSGTGSSGASSSPLPAQSTKEGLRLYVVMTAEAVASAAQGLLVFLL